MKFFNKLAIVALVAVSSIAIAEPNFEILNKSNKTLIVDMKSNGRFPIQYIQPGNTYMTSVPSNTPVYLKLQEHGMTDKAIFKRIKATPKTKYIAFNPGKSPAVYPQTGPLMGLAKKTDSGLSLANNVDAKDIENIKPNEFDKGY